MSPRSWFRRGKEPAGPLNLTLVCDRSLNDGTTLAAVLEIFADAAPGWSARIVVDDHGSPTEVPRDADGVIRVLRRAAEPGETYHHLIEQLRAGNVPLLERFTANLEVVGATDELYVFLGIDDAPLARTGGKLTLPNMLEIRVKGDRVDGFSGHDWARTTFARLTAVVRPAWGAVFDDQEYWAKVVTSGPSMQAVGRDFARFLPGLFPVNYFGPRYVELIGRDRLMQPPEGTSQPLDEGVVVDLGFDPHAWRTAEARRVSNRVLKHLGKEYFFDIGSRVRGTKAPRW